MRRISTLILLLASVLPAAAQETPAQWAVKLGSRNYAERERAALALEQLGKAAMPALRALAMAADLETKRRAILIMEKIEDRVMIEELSSATPLRLRFKDVPINDALREVAKQTGLPCGNVPGMKRIADVDSGVVPFWQAWRRFCDAAHLQERDYARSSAKLRRPRDAELKVLSSLLSTSDIDIRPRFAADMAFAAAPLADRYSGDDRHSVRVRVQWLEMDRSLDEKSPHAVFAVEVRAEPRLEIVKMPRAEITKIIDATGAARPVRPLKLVPDSAGPETALILAAHTGEIQYGGLLQLKPIAWEGLPVTLKELHGKVRLEVMARPKLLEIANVAKAIGKEVRSYDGIVLKVLEANNEEGEIQLRVQLDNLGILAPQTPEQKIVRVRPGVIAVRGEIDVALERLELRDAGGRKCTLIRSRYEQAAKGKGYDAELSFATTGSTTEELTLVMTKAPRTVPLEIPFVVRDVTWIPTE